LVFILNGACDELGLIFFKSARYFAKNAEKQQLYVSVVFKLQQKVNFCQKVTVQ